MITLENIDIGYQTPRGVKMVAEDISATLNAGELTCLLGANGVGKSTLLKTLSGFQPLLGGDARYQGESSGVATEVSLVRMSGQERARLIAVVLTQRTTMQDMTVRELISMGRAPYTGFWGRLTQDDERIITEAMQDTGIESFADRQVMKLSDGERQKVMIAKALAQQTPVIFLDEPTAFLDYPSKVETMQLLLRLCHEYDKTIFLSTHDVEIALQMADKLWLMEKDESTTITIGTPHELADNGAIARFIERENVAFQPNDLTIKITT